MLGVHLGNMPQDILTVREQRVEVILQEIKSGEVITNRLCQYTSGWILLPGHIQPIPV